ncbi:MAG: PhoU domain-containing protein [Candidatus Bathyarchaeia archaeon]
MDGSKSIEAFEARSVELVKEVMKKDDKVDEIYNERYGVFLI